MDLTERELELIRAAVFFYMCDRNHPKHVEKELDELYLKLSGE